MSAILADRPPTLSPRSPGTPGAFQPTCPLRPRSSVYILADRTITMKVLVIEDSSRMAQTLHKGLTEECYHVDLAADGETGLRMARTGEYDLVLLDVNLPGIDGLTLVRELRKFRSDVPVVMVTARDSLEDRIAGLDGGADDYVVKPFSFQELLARIRAVTRRPGARQEAVLRVHDVELDPASGRASRAGVPLDLSAREFALLRTLMRSAGRIMSRAALYEAVWG